MSYKSAIIYLNYEHSAFIFYYYFIYMLPSRIIKRNYIKTNIIANTNNIEKVFGNIPIFWINLYDSVNRFNNMNEQLKNYPFNHKIGAIDGRNEDTFKRQYDVKCINPKNFCTAVIAVICSHIKAIKKGFDLGYDNICVFEDDTNFELIPYYPHTLKDIISITPTDWDIIQLFHSNIANDLNEYTLKGLSVYKRNIDSSGTCYLINRNGMKKILQNIETDGDTKYNITCPIVNPEHAIFSQLNAYVLNLPFLYYQSNEMTFDEYNKGSNAKLLCQKIHMETKIQLTTFIKKLYNNRWTGRRRRKP